MRWEYESPERKLFLVDGTNVWFYVPADHVASRAKVKDSADWRTPIALLAGKADMSQLCKSLEIVKDAGLKPGAITATPGLDFVAPPFRVASVIRPIRLRGLQDAGLKPGATTPAPGLDFVAPPFRVASVIRPIRLRGLQDAGLKPGATTDTVLRCVPRGKSDDPQTPREILFEVNPQAYLVRVVIREPGDIEMEFRFGNWQENIPVPETKFHFQPPPGVAVVDEQTLAGELR